MDSWWVSQAKTQLVGKAETHAKSKTNEQLKVTHAFGIDIRIDVRIDTPRRRQLLSRPTRQVASIHLKVAQSLRNKLSALIKLVYLP